MGKIKASIQHVSVFRIQNVYLIGVLYDFQSDNQEGSVDIIVQGNNISVWIDEADGPMKGRTAMATAAVHIISAAGPIPAFNVQKTDDQVITVPVFSLKGQDELKVAGEFIGLSASVKQTLQLVPESDLGEDIAAVAREWGWSGW